MCYLMESESMLFVTAYLIFTAFQIRFPTASLIFTAPKLFHQQDIRNIEK